MRSLPLRIAIFWACYLGILVAASVVKGMAPPKFGPFLWGSVSTLALLLLTWLLLRFEKRSLREVGAGVVRGSAGRLLLGVVFGLLLYGLHLAIVSTLGGPLGFERNSGIGSTAIVLAVATYGALSSMEELGFRGYPLRTLSTSLGAAWALIITAVAFGLSHILYGWSPLLVVAGVVPGALLFGTAALASGGVALPIGLHAAWNFGSWAAGDKAEPGIWTTNVSDAVRSRVETVGSVSYLATMLLASVGFWLWYRRRRNPA